MIVGPSDSESAVSVAAAVTHCVGLTDGSASQVLAARAVFLKKTLSDLSTRDGLLTWKLVFISLLMLASC